MDAARPAGTPPVIGASSVAGTLTRDEVRPMINDPTLTVRLAEHTAGRAARRARRAGRHSGTTGHPSGRLRTAGRAR
jgi:ribosomal protein L19E